MPDRSGRPSATRPASARTRCALHGVTVIEVLLALVILGVIAALAIPQFSRASAGDDREELRARLALLRNAVELYRQQHGRWPGLPPQDSAGAPPGKLVEQQLTGFTDADGASAAARDARHPFGPYLREGIPACPVGPFRGSTAIFVIRGAALPAFTPEAVGAGWVYNCDTGDLAANSDHLDAAGTRHDRY